MSRSVDYDERLHRGYEAGRKLSQDAVNVWRGALSRRLPPRRPLTIVDIGSGTGRFSGIIADEGAGPVYAVEPSQCMRTVAVQEHPHCAVRYLAGRVEAIPLATASCDAAVLLFVLHHVADLQAAADELARVVRADGRVLVAGSFSDRLHPRTYYRYMPRTREIESKTFPELATVAQVFTRAGFTFLDLDEVAHEIAGSLAAYCTRLRHRAISSLEDLTEDEFHTGLARLAADADAETTQHVIRHTHDLVTFRLTGG